VPLLAFSNAMDRRARARSESRTMWILTAGCALAVVELATNALPIAMAAMSDAIESTMYTLTLSWPTWRMLRCWLPSQSFRHWLQRHSRDGYASQVLQFAALALVRAFASLLGATALDAAASILFVAFVGLMSMRMLVLGEAGRSGGG